MQQLIKEGNEVRIVSVFTEGDSPLYRTRRAEDCKAASEIGATVTHLQFPDAPFRAPQYRDFCGIVFGRAREYPATCRAVADKIKQLISRFGPRRIVAPLAVGNHVDHRLVRDAALLAAPPDELLFYEDRPYAFVREQVQHVLGRSFSQRPLRVWNRYFAAFYVRTYGHSTNPQRIREGWATVPAFPGPYKLHRAFQVEPHPCTLAALSAYKSQLPDLFANDAQMEALFSSVPERLYRVSRRSGA